jgi:cobalt-zinc-cadmium efflux system membrane fusion protein
MKYIKNNIRISYIFCLLLTLSACSHDHSSHDGHNHGTDATAHTEDDGHNHGTEAGGHSEDTGEIHLTRAQMESMNIQFGSFSQIKINDYIKATGSLGLPPNAMTSVSAKANGFIKESNTYIEGSYVKKGKVMAYLENPDFINKQQEYLEITAELTFSKQELERQKTLAAANAGVEKKVQQFEAEVNRKIATLKGIAKQLAYLGINANTLSPDNIVQRVPIIAPMSGYITSIIMHNGMYVTPNLELMEIVNQEHYHLELDVFEKDIAHLKEEQKISYTVPALGNKVYEGRVHVIGKEFNTENKTVRVHGHSEKEHPPFYKDLFIDAKIWLSDQTAQALPEKAIIKDGASSYIYVSNNEENNGEITFEKLMVLPKITAKGFTSLEILASIPAGKKIVTEGAFFIYAQSKAGVLKHEH